MRQVAAAFAGFLFAAMLILTGVIPAGTARGEQGKRYAVTITNTSSNQPVIQPVVICHNRDFHLLSKEPSSIKYLTKLAERGEAAPLLAHVASLPSIYEATASSKPVLPKSSVVIEISGNSGFRFISVAGMPANMKSIIFAVQEVLVPEEGEETVAAGMYEVSTNDDSEPCAHTLGSSCSNFRSAGTRGIIFAGSGADTPKGSISAVKDSVQVPFIEVSVRLLQ